MVFTAPAWYYLTATSTQDSDIYPVVPTKREPSMRYSRFFIPTAREAPKDAAVQSHILMIRAGIVARLSRGLYGFLPLGNRVLKKVEKIIREEMERIEANEFFLPVLIPGELWKESNRWYSMGAELFRLKDRNKAREEKDGFLRTCAKERARDAPKKDFAQAAQ